MRTEEFLPISPTVNMHLKCIFCDHLCSDITECMHAWMTVLPVQQKSLFCSQDVFVHVAPLPPNERTPALINCGPGSELCEEDSTSCALCLPQNVHQVLMWESNTNIQTYVYVCIHAVCSCDGTVDVVYLTDMWWVGVWISCVGVAGLHIHTR